MNPFVKTTCLRCVATVVLSAMVALAVHARRTEADVQAYIERYRLLALEHEMTFHIPACITLAQGLLESDAGMSELASKYNNHFGIKSFNWRGQVACYGDSSRRSCYRVYGTSEDSFLDHAKFLQSARYDTLYRLDITDYRAWAEGLRRCGYAEDKAYPQKLIALIERYQLNALSAVALPGSGNAVDKARQRAEREAKREAEKAAKAAEKERLKHERELAKQRKQAEEDALKQRHEQEKAAAIAERERRQAEREQELARQRAEREQAKRERAERYAARQAAAVKQRHDAEETSAANRRAARQNALTQDRPAIAANASSDND